MTKYVFGQHFLNQSVRLNVRNSTTSAILRCSVTSVHFTISYPAYVVGRHAQLTRCFSAVAELLVVIAGALYFLYTTKTTYGWCIKCSNITGSQIGFNSRLVYCLTECQYLSLPLVWNSLGYRLSSSKSSQSWLTADARHFGLCTSTHETKTPWISSDWSQLCFPIWLRMLRWRATTRSADRGENVSVTFTTSRAR